MKKPYLILGCFIDGPACFGVPSFISPYPRYVFGARGGEHCSFCSEGLVTGAGKGKSGEIIMLRPLRGTDELAALARAVQEVILEMMRFYTVTGDWLRRDESRES